MILSEKLIPFISLGIFVYFYIDPAMFFMILYAIKTNFYNKNMFIYSKKVHLSEEFKKMLSNLKKGDTDDTYGMKDDDMQSVVFSKIVKYLFTNCVRFWRKLNIVEKKNLEFIIFFLNKILN